MNRTIASIIVALGLAAGWAHAQSTEPIIYPAKGQGTQQQDKDKYQCHGWAREQTGFDPLQPSQPAAASQPNASQQAAGGFVKGAAVGAAVGELVSHDAGRGAAAGGLSAAMLQTARKHQAAQAQQQAQQQAAQQQAARNQQKATFDRAFGACMEARGYVVK